jgi:hypothetical protein
MRQLSFFLVATALLFSSCKKDKTKTELLTGSWKLTNAVSGGTNLFSQLPACSKDNVFTFLANGSTTNDEGPTKCSTTDPQTRTTTWRWGANETELIVDNDIAKLISLTETTLVISQSSSRGITEITFTKL